MNRNEMCSVPFPGLVKGPSMRRKGDESQRLCRLMCGGGCAPPSSAPNCMGFARKGRTEKRRRLRETRIKRDTHVEDYIDRSVTT
jgi:hypothetical protein